MSPILSSETVRLVHDAMVREQLALWRVDRSPGFIRQAIAKAFVAVGDRLDPTVRCAGAPLAPTRRLRAA